MKKKANNQNGDGIRFEKKTHIEILGYIVPFVPREGLISERLKTASLIPG